MAKVAKEGEAEAFGFIGSPTILIDGHDESREWIIHHHFKAVVGYTCTRKRCLRFPQRR
jgi:hypothetical protein